MSRKPRRSEGTRKRSLRLRSGRLYCLDRRSVSGASQGNSEASAADRLNVSAAIGWIAGLDRGALLGLKANSLVAAIAERLILCGAAPAERCAARADDLFFAFVQELESTLHKKWTIRARLNGRLDLPATLLWGRFSPILQNVLERSRRTPVDRCRHLGNRCSRGLHPAPPPCVEDRGQRRQALFGMNADIRIEGDRDPGCCV